ncbi:long-chain-fatty-acid--CoA ligase 4 [Eurytemora carolleeae]|uniref:long-chain-fatty-acid--CoA ligase 4 n=1 Tax=Eurytemora carolleeae TaxID=1294199 RepID=UPI000C775EDE|nr:long-chain-fatty-acid--CoA ligase 4 [Eurytemora carolleeae]|eukprot:XP_023327811.1 long-chain-fatty-acid--CoA ligase 4-like [Eurytemora affinis]
MIVDIFLTVAQVIVFVYDVVTYPVYHALSQPWKKGKGGNPAPVPYLVTSSSEEVHFRRDKSNDNPTYKEIIIENKVDTVTKAFNYSVRKHGSKQCLGTREVLGEEDEMQDNGKMFKKLSLGSYRWISYNEAHVISSNFGKGLRVLGEQPQTPIAIYAETRAEWIMSAFGAFSQRIVVSTLYTNLGDEAIIHGLNETEVGLVITSHEMLPKFKNMLPQCPKIHTIVYLEDQLFPTDTSGFKEGVRILPFKTVVKMGEESKLEENHPSADDTAIIMYTSGSTGVPKGVVLTHENLISTSTCIMFLSGFNADDVYIGYLPLAHVLELLSECTMMMFGVPVGYSSPNTMTDMSTKVKRGQKGDASVLKPTMMCVVPLILDRIYKNIIDSVNKRGVNFQKVFEFCYRYKLYWTRSGSQTPIVDRIVFNKIKALLGGRMRFAITGGAPLSPETHDFIRVCLGLTLVQGYSMTETTCSGTCMEPEDATTGKVGPAMAGMEVKLINWEEGNYRVTDKPFPRGEILIGGKSVAKGYFKNDELTKEDFSIENGKRWFKSGDIGEMDRDGVLRIIDRKKDLVKLQLGEYVSLGKVESQLKTHPLVENICVYGDSLQYHTVAIMVPIKNALEKLATELGKTEMNYERLCKDNDVIQAVLKTLSLHGKKTNLERFEIPTRITLEPEPWTPESGLVTAAFKLKRKVIQTMFQPSIDLMYSDMV